MGGPLDWIRSVFGRQQARVDQAINPAAGTTGEPLGMDLYTYYGMDAIGDYLRVDQDLVARYLDYNEMISYPEIAAAVDVYAEDACITADTEIPFLDGTTRTVGDLYARGVKDGWVYGYSREKDRFTATCFERVDMVNPNIEILEVVYRKRTGETGSIKVTPEHKFLLRNKEYVRASDLKVGDRLMPLYRCQSRLSPRAKKKYERIMIDPKSSCKKWLPTHIMVASELYTAVQLDGKQVHHKDENTLNNDPSNLDPKTPEEHASDHHAERRDYSDQELVEKLRKQIKGGRRGIQKAALGVGHSVSELWHLVKRMGYSGWNDFLVSCRVPIRKLDHQKPGTDEDRLEQALAAYAAAPEGGAKRAAKTIGYSTGGFYLFLKRMGITPVRFKEMAEAGVDGNHQVVEIKAAGRAAVYDLVNSRQTGNFAAGRDGQYVVVKNTQPNTMTGDTVWIESDDEEVRTDLSTMLKKRVDIENEIWGIAKTLTMYGNDYSEILVAKDEGVVGLHALPPETMRRIEGLKGELLGFVQDPTGQFRVQPSEFVEILAKKKPIPGGVAVFEPWQVVHDRLQNQYRQSPYGSSILEPARWIWKRLLLLEDAMLIYRLTRAPSRFAFYVDVGDMPPRQAMRYMQTMRQNFRKKKFVNPQTGKLDLRFSPLAQDEDFYIPVRGGRESTRIDVLQGPDFPGSTEDTMYFFQKLLTALKVPPAFLGREENTSAKNVLAHEDVRFARAVMRVQRELRNGLKRVCNVHLASRNIDPESVDYEVFMTTPSGIYELAQMEIRKARVEFAELLQDGEWVSKRWIMREILGFSDDQVDQMMKERVAEEESGAPPDRRPAPRPSGPPPTEELQPGEKYKRGAHGRVIVDDIDSGSKKAEAYAKKHLDEMLKHNKGMDKRLAFLSGLCQDIRLNMPRNGKH